ncbi:MerR family DNA-binding transcriptional regulator [Spirillospora sp. NBC_00431]
MRIGGLAARTGVSVRSLRYYEQQQGLLAAARLATHRDYIDKRTADLTDTRDRLDSIITGATTNMFTGRYCQATDTPGVRPDPVRW